MCIIAAKPAGVKMPDEKTLENLWYGNPDGAGIMYATPDGKVRIEKGLMSLLAFEEKLDELRQTVDLDATGVVLHFRITTHGGTCAANTHPFPISDNIKLLQRTRLTTSVGVAHNGVIPVTPRTKDISDTMEYIASQLAPLSRALPEWYHNADALDLVKNGIQSKMAVLTGTGEIVTIGDFVEKDGMLYSNHSFEGWGRYRGGIYGSYSWRDDDLDACAAYAKNKSTGKTKTKAKNKTKSKSTEPLKLSACTTKFLSTTTLVTRIPLMWIPDRDSGGYVTNTAGELLDPEDYFLDRKLNVYVYDYDADCAMICPGYTAYTANSVSLSYDPNLAELTYVLDESRAPWDDRAPL